MVWRLNRHAETKEGLDIVVEDPLHMEETGGFGRGRGRRDKGGRGGEGGRIEWAGCRREERRIWWKR